MKTKLPALRLAPCILLFLMSFGLASCGGDTSPQPKDAMQHSTPAKTQKTQDPADYATVVQALYVAYFGRPADPAGLANFESALAAAGAPTDIKTFAADYSSNSTIQSLVDAFGSSKESQTLYGTNGGSQAFVTAVFQNLLGRAPQASGLAYWSGAIDSGSVSQGAAALAIMAGALANTTAQGLQDAQLIDNRLSVAADFTDQVTQLNGVPSYAGANAAQMARTMLSGVLADTSISSFESASVSNAITQIIDAGPNLQLFVGNLGGPGTTNGPASQARFTDPAAIALSGGTAYVADLYSHVIRKVTSDGTATTLAGTAYEVGSVDGMGAEARFYSIGGIATDALGNIYVTDNNTVRKITADGVVTTLAGTAGSSGAVDGAGSAARFGGLSGIATDATGNIYVADSGNGSIRKITAAGVVSTFASISNVVFVGVDQSGNVYAATEYAVYQVGTAGVLSLIAGGTQGATATDGSGKAASFVNILGFAIGPDENLYVVDMAAPPSIDGQLQLPASIRQVTPSGNVKTVIGASAGLLYGSYMTQLVGLAVDSAGNFYFGDTFDGVLDVVTSSGQVTLLAGSPITGGTADGTGATATFDDIMAMVGDSQGNLYVIDEGAIRKVTSAGVVTTIAGSQSAIGSADGMGSAATFNEPSGIAIDSNGNLFVADTLNCTIRKVDQSGMVSTFAGSAGKCGHVDGAASAAEFDAPAGIAFDNTGIMYVAEADYVRKIDASGNVTTLAGSGNNQTLFNGIGSAAGLSYLGGIVLDTAGNVYVSEPYINDIRKISPAGVVTSFAGALPGPNFDPYGGDADGNGTAASFSKPLGLAIDGAGNIYVADSTNNTVRKITPGGTVSTLVGSPDALEYGFTPGALPGVLPGNPVLPQAVVVSGSSLYIGCGPGIAVVRNLP